MQKGGRKKTFLIHDLTWATLGISFRCESELYNVKEYESTSVKVTLHPMQIVAICSYVKPHTCWHTDSSKETCWLYYEHFKDQHLLCTLLKRLSHPQFRQLSPSLRWTLVLGVSILCLSLPRHKSPHSSISTSQIQSTKTGTANFKGTFVGFLWWLWFLLFYDRLFWV